MQRNFWLLCLAVLGLIVVGPHCTKNTGGSGSGIGGQWDGASATMSTSSTCDPYQCSDGSDGSVWQDGSGTGATGGTTSTGGGGAATTSTTDVSWGGGDGVGSPTCHDCACLFKTSDFLPGCADRCDSALNGGTADFCNNAPTTSEGCAACIKDTCGQVDPTMCL